MIAGEHCHASQRKCRCITGASAIEGGPADEVSAAVGSERLRDGRRPGLRLNGSWRRFRLMVPLGSIRLVISTFRA